MNRLNISAELAINKYPGRGIAVGRSNDGKNAVIAYFIMGRSANSRNRVFEETKGGIVTQAADPAKLEDPSLIIYAPVRKHKNTHIVTNGDQTDTIYEGMKTGRSFAKSLRKRTFEPDAPNFTPRISAIVKVKNDKMHYKMAILKSADGNADSARRVFFEYPQPIAGEGHFLHTYKCDGDPLPSFSGEPTAIDVPNDIDTFANAIWNSLDSDNKISLFVRYIDIKTGEYKDVIKNKYTRAKSGKK